MESDAAEVFNKVLDNALDQKEFTSPTAYLEALDVIISCSSLLRSDQTSPNVQESIGDLLTKARRLLVDNAVNLLLQTLRLLRNKQALPEFWRGVYSLEEAELWLRMFDVILFCWTREGGLSNTIDQFISGINQDIKDNRAYLEFNEEEINNGLPHLLDECASQLTEIQLLCKPKFITLLCLLKKPPTQQMQPMLKVVKCCLELAGALNVNDCPSEPSRVNFTPIKQALSTTNLNHFSRLADFNALTENTKAMRHFRDTYVLDKDLTCKSIMEINLKAFKNPDWQVFKKVCSLVLKWLGSLEKLHRFKSRIFPPDGPNRLQNLLVTKVESIIVRQLDKISSFTQYNHYSQELIDYLQEQRALLMTPSTQMTDAKVTDSEELSERHFDSPPAQNVVLQLEVFTEVLDPRKKSHTVS